MNFLFKMLVIVAQNVYIVEQHSNLIKNIVKISLVDSQKPEAKNSAVFFLSIEKNIQEIH